MYLLFLFLLAFFFISIFSTNWPVKVYHHYLLSKLAQDLGVAIEKNSVFSNIYSQIDTSFEGRNLKIRFVDGSVDSLRANPGLEIRVNYSSRFLMEFYRVFEKKREWGDFKRFITGEKAVDDAWFILTNNPEMAAELWQDKTMQLQKLLNDYTVVNQILINKNEIIVQLRRYHSCNAITSLLKLLLDTFEIINL